MTNHQSSNIQLSFDADEKSTKTKIDVVELPFETEQLRAELSRFLNTSYSMPDGSVIRLGNVKWGVYAFYDYDGEPIYVGQTKEMLGSRIRRHLTNQRTDAVAMNVLDPFEVHSVVVYPLPKLQAINAKNPEGIATLNALERIVFDKAIRESRFNAILNEKDPPQALVEVDLPEPVNGIIVSATVSGLRDHPDLRIARRAATLAKLAQVISERKVQQGLRRTLLAQAKRLQHLAENRLNNSAENVEDED